MKDLPDIRRVKLSDLKVDKRNANKGTDVGRDLLKSSLTRYGIGRGALVDKDLNMIAGNHSLQEIKRQGYTDVIVVPTDGKTLVITQRMDVQLDSKVGREMALADNRVTEANLDFDIDTISALGVEFNLDLESLSIDVEFIEDQTENDRTEAMEMPYVEKRMPGDVAGREQQRTETAIVQNLFPVMAALTKVQRLDFDAYKKRFDAASDTETVLEMMRLLK